MTVADEGAGIDRSSGLRHQLQNAGGRDIDRRGLRRPAQDM